MHEGETQGELIEKDKLTLIKKKHQEQRATPTIPALRRYPSPGKQGHVSLHAKSSVFPLRSCLGMTGPVEKRVLGRGEAMGTLQDLGSEDRIKTGA